MNSNELAKLIDAFERSRLVTLWGAPGVGKSHACARYANEVVARDGSPIGSSCVSSHDLQDAADPEDVLRTLTCDLPYPVKDAATALAGLEQTDGHTAGQRPDGAAAGVGL